MAAPPRSSPPTENHDPLPLLRALLERPPRSSRRASDQASLDLLGTLLETRPTPAAKRLAPIALRSVEEHRAHALRGFRRRTWVDHGLAYVERGLIIVALLVFGWWLVDGPLRDWLHERSVGSTTITIAAPLQQAVTPIALPFVTSAMQKAEVAAPLLAVSVPAAPSDDFIAPRRAAADKPMAVVAAPTQLLIPSINLATPVNEVFVVDGVWEVAEYAAGYMHGTALPGEVGGNTALAGHAGLRGAVFRDLGQLNTGDDIFLDAGGWRYHYRVSGSTSVWPTQTEVLATSDKPLLTLITCTNWDTQRLIVTADLIGSKPVPAS